MEIKELRNIHLGADIYVVGSGGSLDYLDPVFFAGKITVGINRISLKWAPMTYSVTKYWSTADELVTAGHVAVVSAGNLGGNSKYPLSPTGLTDRYVFRHRPNAGKSFAPYKHWPDDPDMLVVSWSTITSGMHLAAYMGAANILIVGADAGKLGDSTNVSGYYGPEEDQLSLVQGFEPQTIAVKQRLIELYGVRIYGLSPFITPNLEGVPYVGRNRINC